MAPASLFWVMSSLLVSSNSKDRDDVFSSLATPCDPQAGSVLKSLFTFATEMEGRLESGNS